MLNDHATTATTTVLPVFTRHRIGYSTHFRNRYRCESCTNLPRPVEIITLLFNTIITKNKK